MTTRRTFLQSSAAVGLGVVLRWRIDPTNGLVRPVYASVQRQQTPLPGRAIPQFVTPLTTFVGRRVRGAFAEVGMFEVQQNVLPDSFYERLPDRFKRGTYIWGYRVRGRDDDVGVGSNGRAGRGAQASWPGVTVEARRGIATTVKYVNNLPRDPVLRTLLSIDQTIHWADPLNQLGARQPYTGPIPTVVHLHGGEDQSTSDGAPEAWFTNNGLRGPGYFSVYATDPNAAVYHYPNTQEATTLWFHDHALGITRINVFAGLAAFYLIRDEFDTGRSDNQLRLPAGEREIELLMQDRQFDTNGQLLFPDGSATDPNSVFNGDPPNPGIHPFWIPEFFGDVMCVNGRSWPYLDVEPRRYRFRIVNGCNARFLRMRLADAHSLAPGSGPTIWQIGTDGGLLDRPVPTGGQTDLPLFLSPAERADVIVDFTGWRGRSFTLNNDAEAPFPSGHAPGSNGAPATAGVIMQFRVRQPLSSRDTTFNPATDGALRGGRNQAPLIVRLPTSNPHRKRQLVLVEVQGSGGPIEVLVNNSHWDGLRETTSTPIPGSRQPQSPDQGLWLTELPRIGSTEVWEIFNLTEDAHPIHIHLVQFQLMNRQLAIVSSDGEPTYRAVYDAAFPGGQGPSQESNGSLGVMAFPPGMFIPGFGPPRDYNTPNADGAVGGNPAFSAYLTDQRVPPDPTENGWKDTLKMLPRQVTRIVARWAPQRLRPADVQPGQNLYSFDATSGPGYGWHCHILDHEDNVMMRPYLPIQ